MQRTLFLDEAAGCSLGCAVFRYRSSFACLLACTAIGVWSGPLVAFSANEEAAEVAPPPHRTPLGAATLAPSLKAAALRDGISLSLDDSGEPAERRIGDAVVAWVGTSEGDSIRQWLCQFRRAEPTPKEMKKAGRKRQQLKYLSWGPVISFESAMEYIDLWIAGPVDPAVAPPNTAEPAETRRLRIRMPGDYLRLGLDRSALVDMHIAKFMRAAHLANEDVNLGQIYAMERPIKPEAIAYAKPVAERIGFTPEMARAWIGGNVALQAFYDVADDIKVLHRIAEIAVDNPSVWKLAKLATGTRFKASLGNGQSRPVDPVRYGLPPVSYECFNLGFSMLFGDDPMTSGEMIVTRPRPPLDVTAGVLALLAVNPKDTSRMVHVVVIAMQHGPASVDPRHRGAAR